MKKSLSLILFLLFLWKSNASDTTRVLFIGNSITYYNEMPTMFQEIANNRGKNIKTIMYAPGGTGFVNHVADANVYDLFRNSYWDIIVLQPGSGESAGSTFPVDTTIKRGRILLDSIYRYSPCAKVYLYEIPYGVPSVETWATYFSVQTIIKDSVLKMTDSLQLQMIPAGECARAYYSVNPNLLLHNSYNDIHPSAFGSFLTATAFYTGIFQESVSACTYYSTIEPDSARNFFAIADSVILNHLTDWRINNHQITSDFSYTITGDSTTFNCLSLNYTNVFWDFGDGSTSVAINPTHSYLTSGVFTVTLISYSNNGCIDSVSQQINIIPSTSNETIITQSGISVYPNPATNKLWIYITGKSNLSYKIFQISGGEVKSGYIDRLNNHLDISSLQDGPYFIVFLENDKRIAISKFCKIR
jgi:PKD repeat protein